MKRLFTIIVFFFVLFCNNSYSQLTLNIATMNYYDDNIFRSLQKTGSMINTATLGTVYNIENEKSLLKFSYNANLTYFKNIPDRDYNEHTFLTDYTILLDSEESGINLGGGYSFRSDKDVYNIYDEKNLGMYFNYKFNFSDDFSGMAGYNFNSIQYPNVQELSYSEHIFNFASNFSFQTKTTYIFEINLGLKNYSQNIYSTSTIFDTIFMPGNGMGHGNGMKFAHQGSSDITSTVSRSPLENLTSQILISNRISQSLNDKLGAQFTYSWRYNLKKNSRMIYSGDSFTSDDELFDDHYGFSGHEFNIGFTQLLPLGLILKLDGEYLLKNYVNSYYKELTANSALSDRNDNKFIINLNLKKNFSIFENALNPLSISISYIYHKNNSNISYYNYNSNSIFLNLYTNFNF